MNMNLVPHLKAVIYKLIEKESRNLISFQGGNLCNILLGNIPQFT